MARSPIFYRMLIWIALIGCYEVGLVNATPRNYLVDALATGQESEQVIELVPTIQQAIVLAQSGDTIFVAPGTYREHLDFLGKSICLQGADPEAALKQAYPVLVGFDARPVVRFTQGEDSGCQMTGFVIAHEGPWSGGAIQCLGSHPTITHCLIAGHRLADNGAVVYCSDSWARLSNCTIADNKGGGMVLVNSPMILANSIVWGNTGAALIVQGTDIPVVRYCNVTGNWPGLGNGDVDPCFAAWGTWVDVLTGEPVAESSNPEFAIWRTGDYHVQSQAGRWDPEAWTWVVDTVTSPCIDGGDPGDAIGIEPIPTGEIVNMGVYGATNQASRSYITDRPAPFKEPRLKEVVENVLGIFDPTPADLLDLTDLDQIAEGQIYFHSLSGIEPAINLRTLKLDEHGLRETSWLSGLTNLKSLNISDQFVGTTLDGLQELVHLEYLNIHRSQIYDLRPLAGLTQLRTLIVNRNNLYGDLESLRNLTQLEWLDVRGNNLSDLSALEDMTHLKRLIIYDNLWTDQEAILDQIRSNNPGIVIDE